MYSVVKNEARSATEEKVRFFTNPAYQFLPPLTDEVYADLKADIAKNGVLVPISADKHGCVLDGAPREKRPYRTNCSGDV